MTEIRVWNWRQLDADGRCFFRWWSASRFLKTNGYSVPEALYQQLIHLGHAWTREPIDADETAGESIHERDDPLVQQARLTPAEQAIVADWAPHWPHQDQAERDRLIMGCALEHRLSEDARIPAWMFRWSPGDPIRSEIS